MYINFNELNKSSPPPRRDPHLPPQPDGGSPDAPPPPVRGAGVQQGIPTRRASRQVTFLEIDKFC